MTPRRLTAGVVIIGDEVLSGKVEEANAGFFIERFRDLGVSLARIAFIGDDVDEIADTVRAFAGRYDLVCTTGGIGPTHDDLTMFGVARAFAREVVEHPALVAMLDEHLGGAATAGHRRMARVPDGAELVVGDGKWPTIRVANVYVFPGVPHLLRRKFSALEEAFRGAPTWLAELRLDADEADICAALDAAVARHGDVTIGSYPQLTGQGWTLRLTLEAASLEATSAALEDLQRTLAPHVLGAEAPRMTTSHPPGGQGR